MQAPAHALAVRAQMGAVLAVVALSLAPITILLARRLFPGRNVVFARWGFSHVVGVLIFALVLGGLAHEMWPLPEGEMDVQAVLVRNAALMAAIVALIVRFAHKLDPESWRALGLWRGMHARAVATGVSAYILSLPGIVGLALVWPWVLDKLGIAFEPQALLVGFKSLPEDQVLLVAVLIVVVLPLFEEIVFRVFLQPLLVQNFSEKGGVMLTSVLFAVLHGESAFLPVFGLSVVLGAVMLRTQRLSAVWAVHALNNGLVLALVAAFARGEPA